MEPFRIQSIPNASDILQAVIDATPDAIFVKDLEGRYVLANLAAARFVGRTPAEVVGRNDLKLYPEETARRFMQDDRVVLESGKAMVEDEASVRSTVRRQLETLGHTVLLAETAAAALPILKNGQPVDVLLTDVVLGSGMNGIDLADAARVVRPGLPVIFMSGFTAVPEAAQRIKDSGAPLLTKPSTLSQLERALNTAGRP